MNLKPASDTQVEGRKRDLSSACLTSLLERYSSSIFWASVCRQLDPGGSIRECSDYIQTVECLEE